jgi:hypothetical protein
LIDYYQLQNNSIIIYCSPRYKLIGVRLLFVKINRGQVEPPPDLVRHESKTCPQICASGGGTGSQVHVFVLMTHHVAEESGEAWKFRSSIMKIPV